MQKIKLLSQPMQALLLAIYIGIFLNIPVFLRRFDEVKEGLHFSKWLTGSLEVMVVLLFTFFILRVCSLGGRWFFKITATLITLISVAASYYMTAFNVVIGYGIIISVFSPGDLGLFSEVVGWKFVLWFVAASIIPLAIIWLGSAQNTLLEQLKTPGKRIISLVGMALIVAVVWVPLNLMGTAQKKIDQKNNVDMPSYGGVVAHSYLPSNWLAAFGLYGYTALDERQDEADLFDPADHFSYVAPEGIDDTYVVFIIGETARWDHMGILGYERDTTPQLAKEPNLAAFRGESCDTSTKLSLRCMFVREGGTENNAQRTLKEQNIFSVLHQLGFSSELFAMQSEIWFYNNTDSDNFSFRELIAAEHRNDGKPVDDMLLVEELQNSLQKHPNGKHLVVLHTSGSHYLYTQRYPRSYAKFKPECMGVDDSCTKEQLMNSYDNSILYTDNMIKSVIDQVRDKKALVFYASDHGESISDNEHFHGTPREMAPPEQFRVPLMVWASDKFLASGNNAKMFAQVQKQAKQGRTHRHVELYDSILGCLGYTSPNGGINENNNWCRF
ncbi:phosphoethanolamine transferase [Obesumbacterium proteus]|uniref:kdo(2)-lipid A phosphoethanolamine 7''-transferase n=1 Tax=Obesumbacterium proteus TaxID=82983 RepID=UPI000621F389|nr:kdo(2)-lipid A phosphoethanolamine 7''-transferase [Obesumbacterium proteus]KKI47428.1 phosphoethanolamine transferase [Obesumbacterium proteus]